MSAARARGVTGEWSVHVLLHRSVEVPAASCIANVRAIHAHIGGEAGLTVHARASAQPGAVGRARRVRGRQGGLERCRVRGDDALLGGVAVCEALGCETACARPAGGPIGRRCGRVGGETLLCGRGQHLPLTEVVHAIHHEEWRLGVLERGLGKHALAPVGLGCDAPLVEGRLRLHAVRQIIEALAHHVASARHGRDIEEDTRITDAPHVDADVDRLEPLADVVAVDDAGHAPSTAAAQNDAAVLTDGVRRDQIAKHGIEVVLARVVQRLGAVQRHIRRSPGPRERPPVTVACVGDREPREARPRRVAAGVPRPAFDGASGEGLRVVLRAAVVAGCPDMAVGGAVRAGRRARLLHVAGVAPPTALQEEDDRATPRARVRRIPPVVPGRRPIHALGVWVGGLRHQVERQVERRRHDGRHRRLLQAEQRCHHQDTGCSGPALHPPMSLPFTVYSCIESS
eukprot:SAG31_NODE_1332_length_8743_cov_20.800810_7_plen_457_part_00